jgi:hypothetical protein
MMFRGLVQTSERFRGAPATGYRLGVPEQVAVVGHATVEPAAVPRTCLRSGRTRPGRRR